MDALTPHWLNAQSHEPNPVTPEGDGDFTLLAGDVEWRLDLAALRALPFTEIANCTIVSTGHGRSGPFCFGGVRVADCLTAYLPLGAPAALGAPGARVDFVDFIGADGFGTRLTSAQIHGAPAPLLAYMLDGAPMQRAQGLVRLVVPGETDDALQQIKWLARVEVTLCERT